MEASEEKVKKAVSQLAAFPPEVLSLITREVLAADVTNLYACGYEVLNRKLVNGGVTEVNCEFRGKRPIWRFKLLRRLKGVKVLRVESKEKLIEKFGWVVMEGMSENLEVLDFEYFGAISMWARMYSDGLSSPRLGTYPIGAKFPKLRYMRLVGQCWMLDELKDALGTLPAHTQAKLPNLEDFLQKLPLSLRTLVLEENDRLTSGETSSLPRKLSSLSLVSPFSHFLYLPKALQSLSINLKNSVADAQYFSGIPLTLTRLTLKNFTNPPLSFFEAFPRTLLHLHLPHSRGEFPLGPLLHRFTALCTLDAPFLDSPQNLLPPPFPPSLTLLSLGRYPISKPFFDLLPRTLTALRVGSADAPDTNFGLSLPPLLISLSLPALVSPLSLDHQLSLPKRIRLLGTSIQDTT